MKQVVVMQAVSGAGKSTLAKRMVEQARAADMNATIVSADYYFYALGRPADILGDESTWGEYKYDPKTIGNAHDKCFVDFLGYIRDWTEGVVIVDNTNQVIADCAPYIRAASAFGWDASILRISIDPEVAAARGTKGLKPKDVEQMWLNIVSQPYPRWWKIKTVPAQGVE